MIKLVLLYTICIIFTIGIINNSLACSDPLPNAEYSHEYASHYGGSRDDWHDAVQGLVDEITLECVPALSLEETDKEFWRLMAWIGFGLAGATGIFYIIQASAPGFATFDFAPTYQSENDTIGARVTIGF